MSNKKLSPEEESRRKKTEQCLKVIFENPNLKTYFLLAVNPKEDKFQTAVGLEGFQDLAPDRQGCIVGFVVKIISSWIHGARLRLSDEEFAKFMYGISTIHPEIMMQAAGGGDGICQHDLVDGRCWKCGHKS